MEHLVDKFLRTKHVHGHNDSWVDMVARKEGVETCESKGGKQPGAAGTGGKGIPYTRATSSNQFLLSYVPGVSLCVANTVIHI